MSTVWITKTGATAETHDAPGHRVIYHPLLTIEPIRSKPARPLYDDLILFTSQNAVEAFCQLTDERRWTVYTVGDATANIARKSGFKDVVSVGKDVDALINLIDNNHRSNQVSFYYPSANEISVDLPGLLKQRGYIIRRAIVYESVANKTLSPELEKCIGTAQPVSVLLYSVKGAQALLALELNTDSFDLISMSKKIDDALGDISANSRKIAKNPTHTALLKQLG